MTPEKGVVWRNFLARLSEEDTLDYLRTTETEQRESYIRDIASPFLLSDEMLAKVLEDVL